MNKIRKAIRLLIEKNDLSTEEGLRKEREKRVLLSAIIAAIAKLVHTAIPLITVKITLAYLGSELYGLWTTITSFFALFAFADLGLGNGLQTELSRSIAKDDDEANRQIISSCYFVLICVACVLTAALFVAAPLVNWPKIMNAKTAEAIQMTGGFVLAIVLSKIINIPVSLVQRVQNSFQEGYITSAWSVLGSALSLAVVYIFTVLDIGRLAMMWASSFVLVVTSLLNTIAFFAMRKPQLKPSFRYVNKTVSMKLLSTGLWFFALSVLTSAGLSLDNYIVSQVVSLSATTSYSIAYKIASFIGIISVILSTPLWAANGEALERGDYKWVKEQTKKMTVVSFALSLVASIALIVVSKPVLGWLGKEIEVSTVVLAGMCASQICIATASPAFMVLNASRKVKSQMLMYGIFVAVSLMFKLYFGRIYSTIAVAWVGAICYLLIIIPLLAFFVKKEFTEIPSLEVKKSEI